MTTCPACFQVIDVLALPSIAIQAPARRGLPGYDQVDRMCPACGALVSRTIDGEAIAGDYVDRRREKLAPEPEPEPEPGTPGEDDLFAEPLEG